MIKKKCKLFYTMDMFYLIMNKKPTFYLKRWALGGGASIYIYIYMSKYIYASTPIHEKTTQTTKVHISANKKPTPSFTDFPQLFGF